MMKPHIVINMSMSIDGKSVLPEGRWFGLTSKKDREKMDIIRSQSDAILVGYASLKADNANLFDRRKPEKKNHPIPVIFSGSGEIDPELNVWHKPHPKGIIVCPDSYRANSKKIPWKSRMPESYFWKGWQDLPELLDFLCNEKGLQKILVEGGPRVNYRFFQQGLVDEMYLTIVPYIAGGSGSGSVNGIFPRPLPGARLIDSEQLGDELFLHYSFR